jgi:serine/threonine protein kinase
VEFEIESSRDHWTSTDDSTREEEYSVERDRQYFEKLKLDHHCQSQHFFKDLDDLVVGEKIGEGGQGDIYVAGFKETGRETTFDYVVKVLKGDIPLKLLHSQWPPGLFSFSERLNRSNTEKLMRFEFCGPFGGTLLKDERPELNNKFAFVMQRYKDGDLRTLIDKRMLHNNRCLPFSFRQLVPLMYDIAGDMMMMHSQNILHRDMKASNAFIYNRFSGSDLVIDRDGVMRVQIADFESSVGVLRTGFWRAPEILLQLKNRVPSCNIKYTPAADVYSYGMLCYEIVTGRIPF